jgi:hypothetical protein
VRKRLPLIVAGFWLLLVAGAMTMVGEYSNTPGAAGAAPMRWPSDSHIVRHLLRPTLVLIVHPHCPCTAATLGELELLLAQTQKNFDAHVVFVRPEGLSEDWVKSDLWRRASGIPGVTAEIDGAGAESRLFHAETSGEALLYGADGRLLFEGGLTLSRGHSGDNPGRSALVALLNGESAKRNQTPVFGCPLFAPDRHQKEIKCKQ